MGKSRGEGGGDGCDAGGAAGDSGDAVSGMWATTGEQAADAAGGGRACSEVWRAGAWRGRADPVPARPLTAVCRLLLSRPLHALALHTRPPARHTLKRQPPAGQAGRAEAESDSLRLERALRLAERWLRGAPWRRTGSRTPPP